MNLSFCSKIITSLISFFLVLSSCADDTDIREKGESNDSSDKPVTKFMTVKVKSSVSSRSRGDGDFVDGSDDENKVGSKGNIILFFDDTKKYMFTSDLSPVDASKPDNDNIERTYLTVFPVDEDNKPYFCLVALNCSDSIVNALKNYNEADHSVTNILKKLIYWNPDNPMSMGFRHESNGKSYFTLTNSVYFEGIKHHVLSEIDQDKILSTEILARENPAATVYLERTVAKISVEFNGYSDTDGDDKRIFYPIGNDQITLYSVDEDGNLSVKSVKWRIKVTGWIPSGLEKSNYLFKNFFETASFPIKLEDYTNNNSAGLFYTDWNDAGHYRSYWAVDSNYSDETKYPLQWRKSLDDPNRRLYNKPSGGIGSPIKYYPFNGLKPGKTTFYVPENTYGFKASDLEGRSNVIAGTHLLIGAELQLDYGTGDGYQNRGSIYRDRGGNYYDSERAYVWSMVNVLNKQMASVDVMTFPWYQWYIGFEDSKKTELETKNQGYKVYINRHELTYEDIKNRNDLTVYAEVKKGDGERIIWFGDNVSQNNNQETVGVTVGNAENQRVLDRNNMQSLIFEWVGTVDHFNNGRMYYAVPIKHNLSSASDAVGEYGVVRNHWYSFSVNSVKKIGTSVDAPSAEIIPDVDATQDYINVQVQLLDWHIDQQNVILKY